MYRIKPGCPDFTVVDGPLAGRKYEAGKLYEEIPLVETDKFEQVRQEPGLKAVPKGEK